MITNLFKLCVILILLFNCSLFIKNREVIHNNFNDVISLENIFYIPFSKITIDVRSPSVTISEIEYTDSFYLDALNSLLLFEFEKKGVRLIKAGTKCDSCSCELLNVENLVQCCNLKKNDGLVIPVVCSLTQRVFQKNAWKNGKYGSNYEKPLEVVAKSKIQIKIVTGTGNILYDVIGKGKSKRPFLYSLIKRHKKKKDVISLAKSLYGPTPLRALNRGIKNIIY